jgi:hypothetical protein
MSYSHPQQKMHLSGTCSRQAIRPGDARRRYARATAALRDSPLACVWRRTRAGRATLTALADVPPLCDRIDRLTRLRRRHQDLQAAAWATLAASAEGEADPLYYLRDELEASRSLPSEGEAPPW